MSVCRRYQCQICRLQPGADITLQQIFDNIQVAVYKNRVRTIEFFKDYDKLRSGLITENQFVCGLSLAIGKEAQLSRGEIQKVVEYYRTPDGRIRYKEFCDMMENGETLPNSCLEIAFETRPAFLHCRAENDDSRCLVSGPNITLNQ